MKRYSDELVKKLGEEKEIIQSYGTEVIFKESPDVYKRQSSETLKEFQTTQ